MYTHPIRWAGAKAQIPVVVLEDFTNKNPGRTFDKKCRNPSSQVWEKSPRITLTHGQTNQKRPEGVCEKASGKVAETSTAQRGDEKFVQRTFEGTFEGKTCVNEFLSDVCGWKWPQHWTIRWWKVRQFFNKSIMQQLASFKECGYEKTVLWSRVRMPPVRQNR